MEKYFLDYYEIIHINNIILQNNFGLGYGNLPYRN